MKQGGTDQSSRSEREREHAEMLAAAVSRPGVREAMKVFHDWQRKDHALDAYRAAAVRTERTTTTNHANVV